jgi:hypothetical protein
MRLNPLEVGESRYQHEVEISSTATYLGGLQRVGGSAGQEANISNIDCNDLATLPPVRIVVAKVTPAVPIGGKGCIDVTTAPSSVLPPVG